VLFVDFVAGALGMYFFGKIPLKTAELLQFTYLPGDILKAILASIIYAALPNKLILWKK